MHSRFFTAFLRACTPNFKSKDNSFRKLGPYNEVPHVNFHKPYTSKTPSTAFKKHVYAKRDKRMCVNIVEACNNAIIIETSMR